MEVQKTDADKFGAAHKSTQTVPTDFEGSSPINAEEKTLTDAKESAQPDTNDKEDFRRGKKKKQASIRQKSQPDQIIFEPHKQRMGTFSPDDQKSDCCTGHQFVKTEDFDNFLLNYLLFNLQHVGKLLSALSPLGNVSWTQFYQPLFNYWFHQVIFRNPVIEPPFHPRLVSFVDMICIPFQGVNTSHEAMESRFGRPNEKLWFHGTASFQSAFSILNEGVRVDVGKRRNDFSVGEGFYVSDDFDAACCWAERNRDCGYAVLVFRLREQSFSNCFLDLNRNTTLWRKVVRFNRSGYKKEVDLKEVISQGYMGKKNSATLRNLHFNEIDFIKGPICYDVPKTLNDNCTETPIFMTNSYGRVIQQLCIRTHSYAQVFGSLANICAVIWFLPGPQ